jgi:hypothetical protein
MQHSLDCAGIQFSICRVNELLQLHYEGHILTLGVLPHIDLGRCLKYAT